MSNPGDTDSATDATAVVEGDGAEGVHGGKKSKKKLIIILVAVLLLAGGGAGAYFALGKHAPKEAKEETKAGEGKEEAKPVFYTLPEFLVNLNSGTKQVSFLKAIVILELPKETDTPLVEANLPRVQDSFNTYLRELRASDLAGSAGAQRLREELLLRANKALAPVKVSDVLFKEIIVQ